MPLRRLSLWCLGLSGVVPLLTGCHSLRAEIGIGVGFGAELHVPYALHAPAPIGFGKYKYAGHDYDRGWVAGRDDGWWPTSFNFVAHTEGYHDRLVTLKDADSQYLYYEVAEKDTHTCVMLAPYLFDKLNDESTERSTRLELRIYALLFALRLGWDPAALVRGDGSDD